MGNKLAMNTNDMAAEWESSRTGLRVFAARFLSPSIPSLYIGYVICAGISLFRMHCFHLSVRMAYAHDKPNEFG